MDNRSNEVLNASLKKENHGKNYVVSKYTPRFPESTERLYLRMMDDLIQSTLKRSLKEHLPELIKIVKDADETELHTDGMTKRQKENAEKRHLARFEVVENSIIRMRRVFSTIEKELADAFDMYDIKRKLNDIAESCSRQSKSEWKKTVRKTLGINILEDYYDKDFYQNILEQWILENIDMIQTIPKSNLKAMKKIVMEDYLKGKPIRQITADIQSNYSMTKGHARLIARDQIGKLNTKITKHQQEEAGVHKYEWRTAGDSRVRDAHKKLDRQIFSWSSPPEVSPGRNCHPGEDYQCRCIAVSVFEFDKLHIPIDGR